MAVAGIELIGVLIWAHIRQPRSRYRSPTMRYPGDIVSISDIGGVSRSSATRQRERYDHAREGFTAEAYVTDRQIDEVRRQEDGGEISSRRIMCTQTAKISSSFYKDESSAPWRIRWRNRADASQITSPKNLSRWRRRD